MTKNTPQEPHALNELERYDRQKKIWGEAGQKKLAAAKVSIIGSGPTTQYIALPLAALGVGEIRLLGAGEGAGYMLDIPYQGSRVEGYARGLRRLNPQIEIIPLQVNLETRLGRAFLEGSSIVVDATNNPYAKAIALEYAQEKKNPFLTTGVAEHFAKFMLWMPEKDDDREGVAFLMPQYEGHTENPLLALLFGGLVAEEIKKYVLDEKDKVLERELHYKEGQKQRFTFPRREDEELVPLQYGRKKALVIGAGALGNIMALALAESGFYQVHYVDNDVIESHNLNRQVLYYDAVGKSKAKTLAEKFRIMNPKAQVRGIHQKFIKENGRYNLQGKYDVVFDLVDNLYTRALLAAFCVEHDLPLISAASSPQAAQVTTYIPGKTSCPEHVFGEYYERGRKEEIVRRQSCIAQPDPSVIITNQIGAALAALELRSVFGKGKPVNGSLKYATNLPSRLGENPLRNVCDCAQRKEVPDLEIR